MEAGDGLWQPFIISGQSAESCGPGKGAFDHPTPWKQNKANAGFFKFYHTEFNPVLGGILGRFLASIPLINIGDRNILSGDVLHRIRGEEGGNTLRVVLIEDFIIFLIQLFDLPAHLWINRIFLLGASWYAKADK